MATAAISAHGTVLKRGDGGTPTEAFVTISEQMAIVPPPMTRTIMDVTSQSASGWKEYIAGLKEGGVMTVELNWVPTDATQGLSTGVLADYVSGARKNYQLVLPDAAHTTWTIPVIVKDFAPDAGVDTPLKAKISFQVAGQPTLA